mmetsp:Transcript_29459/g.70025  ORF Transcript_29459/g.70025 Transcript_29459/m.70025 type:complete len:298 (-) Transcript_29459:143-1036(-)
MSRRFGRPYGLALTLAAALTLTISRAEEVCEGDHEAETVVDPYSPPIRQLRHKGWESYTIDQLFEEYYECARIIYGYQGVAVVDEDGEGIWDEHVRRIREQLSTIREKYDRDNINNDAPINGGSRPSSMLIPFEVGDAGEHKGRGIFAKEGIQKGQLVIDLDNGSSGYFKDGHEWRKFTVSLSREVACNFIEWSWVQDMPRIDDGDEGEKNDVTDARDGLTIFIAFDESNLINSAEWDHEEANVACGSPPVDDGDYLVGPCRYKFYATRDIEAGEELLINYSEFEDVDQSGWDDIGL